MLFSDQITNRLSYLVGAIWCDWNNASIYIDRSLKLENDDLNYRSMLVQIIPILQESGKDAKLAISNMLKSNNSYVVKLGQMMDNYPDKKRCLSMIG